MDTEFLQKRIDATKRQIIAYEDAVLALGEGGVQTYTLDTGQTRQTVARYDLPRLQDTLESLYNRCVTMELRLSGGGTFTASVP